MPAALKRPNRLPVRGIKRFYCVLFEIDVENALIFAFKVRESSVYTRLSGVFSRITALLECRFAAAHRSIAFLQTGVEAL